MIVYNFVQIKSKHKRMIEILLEKIIQESTQNNLFFLWGMPCSGKSTIGKQLAAQLGYIFIDLDEYIMSKENKTIAQIFQDNGEAFFRMMETHYLNGIIIENAKENINKKIIIATGGGTPCFNENRFEMLLNGFCIFLDVDLNMLIMRIQDDTKNIRPLFIDKTNEEISELIFNFYQKRVPYYEKAHFNLKFA